MDSGQKAEWGNHGAALDRKFLDETADLRKELQEKRFEYAEAVRCPDTSAKEKTGLKKGEKGTLEKNPRYMSPQGIRVWLNEGKRL